DAPRERLEIGQSLRVAKLVQELDHDAPAIDRLVEVEDENFEHRLAGVGDRGTYADRRDARQRPFGEAVDTHCEDAGDRRHPSQMKIGGRKSQRAAELRSVRNAARDGEWKTEHRRGMIEVAGRKRT